MRTPRTSKILWTCAALAALTAGLAPMTAFAGDAAAGKVVYTTNCLHCHGETGMGDGPTGVALQPPPRDFSAGAFMFDPDGDGTKGTDADLKQVITNGGAAFGGSPLMPPWLPLLSDADIDNVIAYVRTLEQ
jgi:mono/diheme cytochrome c family protein